MRPFLKWAGNKYRVIDHILQSLPAGKRLIEPFVGSGAVFLNTDFKRYLLADANPDLIGLYQQLKQEGDDFIEYCASFFVSRNNNENRYYQLRQKFNDSDDIRLRSALFLYLNRHCFNGLCRYNSNHGFNVPFGLYTKPYFPQNELEHFAVKAKKARLLCADFSKAMNQAKTGDVVYCDPPYHPLTETANFTAYTSGSFGLEQQIKLAELAETLRQRGVTVLISNHATDFTHEIYQNAELYHFDIKRTISRNSESRGKKVKELIAVYE